ncbi:hypothetical protein PF010_g31061 [Phytophthora fragariae]|uniref:Uncharacterized protein n=1 Tax=Phytophthora fragariae TaxID=53985 RepID=A0A6G0JJC3_9STRA|nr:hypothetical protein PF010_g31061 [Phytophthora fragariae]
MRVHLTKQQQLDLCTHRRTPQPTGARHLGAGDLQAQAPAQ